MRRDDLEFARNAAASFLRSRGRERDADFIMSGGGDDFPEVQLTLSVLRAAGERIGRMVRALKCYADPTFWEDVAGSPSLASFDQGEIAMNAIAGKELFATQRD
jgi:hypothetical protein